MGLEALVEDARDSGDGVFADRAGEARAQREARRVCANEWHYTGADSACVAAPGRRRDRDSEISEPRTCEGEFRRAASAARCRAACRARPALSAAAGAARAGDAVA